MRRGEPTIRELLTLPSLSDTQISPDGEEVAVVLRQVDETTGRAHRSIQILCRERGWATAEASPETLSGSCPRWSPDGKTLAYLASSAHGNMDLCLRSGEETCVLCSLPPGSHGIQWSPSGSLLSFIASAEESGCSESVPWSLGEDEGDPLELWRVDVNTGQIKQWSQLGGEISDVAWHPNGECIACCLLSTQKSEDWDTGSLVLLSLDQQQSIAVVQNHCQRALWSPDGDRLAVLRLQDPTFISVPCVEIVDREGHEMFRYVMDDDSQIVHWTSLGLLILQANGPCSTPFWMDPSSGKKQPILSDAPEGFTIIEGWFGDGCAMTTDGRTLSATAYDVDHPGEAALLDLDSGRVMYITNVLERFHRWHLPTPERIQWMTSDGVEIEGILIRPRITDPSKRHPLVVVIHGGPTSMSAQAPLADNEWVWGPIPQLVARGAYVLLPNYRGSVGYGQAFKSANVGLLGRVNAEDITAGIEHLIEQGLVDKRRVAAVGASHGGYLAAFLAAYTNMLAAAAMRSGISDWTLNQHLNLNPDWESQYLGDPSTQQGDAYVTASTLPYVNQETAPLLIIHGDQDLQAPTANASVLYRRLQQKGVSSEMILYHGMGHGGATLEQNEHSLQATLKWLEQWLGLTAMGD